MILLTFLYYEYINRPKLTEQKIPFEYIVPIPQVDSEQWNFQSDWDERHVLKRLHYTGDP